MSLKTRRFIFYSFLILFIITGLAVIFYSEGWRMTAKNCQITQWQNCQIKFQKTGAVFIETKPKGVIIKIDGKTFPDKSGLIQSGTLITNLSPKTYKITIEKDGYSPWQKKLQIEPAKVTEILGVVLIPQNFQKQLISLTKPLDNFWINPEQKIVFKASNVLYYFQSSTPFKLRGDEFIQWSGDGSKIIVKDSQKQVYYLYELNNLSKLLNLSVIFNNFDKKAAIDEIVFHPFESTKLIIKNRNGLYLLDLNRLKFENIIKEPIISWTIKNPNIYFIKEVKGQMSKVKSYQLVSFNLILKTESILTDLPISGSKIDVSGENIAILNDNGGLYIFNQKNKNLKQIAHSATNFAFSPDRKKIAFLDKDGKLNIYFLEDYQKGINKKADEVIRLSLYLKSDGLNVENIFWYKDSYHLFIEYRNINADQQNQHKSASIDFIEIDDRSSINKYTLVEDGSNFYYQLSLGRLYFTQESNLYFIEI